MRDARLRSPSPRFQLLAQERHHRTGIPDSPQPALGLVFSASAYLHLAGSVSRLTCANARVDQRSAQRVSQCVGQPNYFRFAYKRLNEFRYVPIDVSYVVVGAVTTRVRKDALFPSAVDFYASNERMDRISVVLFTHAGLAFIELSVVSHC